MSNYKYIKPYSDMIHTASLNGGPANYLRMVAETNYQHGRADEKELYTKANSQRLKNDPFTTVMGTMLYANLYKVGVRIVSSIIKEKTSSREDDGSKCVETIRDINK